MATASLAWEKEYVEANWELLYKATRISDNFKKRLLALRIMPNDIKCQSKDEGSNEYKSWFFEEILNTPKGYGLLIKALLETQQTKAADILFEGLRKNNVSKPLEVCDIQIDYKKILSSDIGFNHQLNNLSKFFTRSEITELKEMLKRTEIDGHEYFNTFITREKQLELIQDTIPDFSGNYYQYKIVNGFKLNSKAFKDLLKNKTENGRDVFVFLNCEIEILKRMDYLQSVISYDNDLLFVENIPGLICLSGESQLADWYAISLCYNGPIHLVEPECVEGLYDFHLIDSNRKSERLGKYLQDEDSSNFKSDFTAITDLGSTAFSILNITGNEKCGFFPSLADMIQKKDPNAIILFVSPTMLTTVEGQIDNISSSNLVAGPLKAIISHIPGMSTISKVYLHKLTEKTEQRFEVFLENVTEDNLEQSIRVLKLIANCRENLSFYVSTNSGLCQQVGQELSLSVYHVLIYDEYKCLVTKKM